MSRPGSRRAVPASRRLVAGLALAALTGLAAGCGGAPRTSPPSGVDGLVVPTPEPEPGDFVERVDNPWLPLEPGASWTYEVVDGSAESTRTVRVLTGTREVSGIEATQVETRGDGAAALAWFAQDRDGNVWALGEQGVWEAGVDGALAGLAMPARPRLGDGYAVWAGVAAGSDGEVELGRVVRVGERESSVTVPAGRFSDLLETTVVDRELPGSAAPLGERTVYYAYGVGEVLGVERDGGRQVELVEHQPAG